MGWQGLGLRQTEMKKGKSLICLELLSVFVVFWTFSILLEIFPHCVSSYNFLQKEFFVFASVQCSFTQTF